MTGANVVVDRVRRAAKAALVEVAVVADREVRGRGVVRKVQVRVHVDRVGMDRDRKVRVSVVDFPVTIVAGRKSQWNAASRCSRCRKLTPQSFRTKRVSSPWRVRSR